MIAICYIDNACTRKLIKTPQMVPNNNQPTPIQRHAHLYKRSQIGKLLK